MLRGVMEKKLIRKSINDDLLHLCLFISEKDKHSALCSITHIREEKHHLTRRMFKATQKRVNDIENVSIYSIGKDSPFGSVITSRVRQRIRCSINLMPTHALPTHGNMMSTLR